MGILIYLIILVGLYQQEEHTVKVIIYKPCICFLTTTNETNDFKLVLHDVICLATCLAMALRDQLQVDCSV